MMISRLLASTAVLALLTGAASAQSLGSPAYKQVTVGGSTITGVGSGSGQVAPGTEVGRAQSAEQANASAAAAAQSTANAAVPSSTLAQPNGPASLNGSGTVPAGQLPIGTGTGQVAPGNLLTALPACTAGSTVAPVATGLPFQCSGLVLIAQ